MVFVLYEIDSQALRCQFRSIIPLNRAADALTGGGSDGTGSSCDFLQLVYESGAKNRDGRGCGEADEASRGRCRQGDLGGKFGKVRVGRRESMFTKVINSFNFIIFSIEFIKFI